MKRTFTLLFVGLMLCSSAVANPFTKKNRKQSREQISKLKAAKAEYLPSSVITDYWNGSDWADPATTNLQYYENGLLWISESPNERMTYTYYENGMVKDHIKEWFDGSDWSFQSKQSYMYDAMGYESQSVYYNWNGSDWEISYGYKYDVVYDENENVIEEISYSYDAVDGWVEDYGYKDESIYTDGLLTEQVYYERSNGAWVPEMKNIWMYDELDVLNGAYEYSYDGSNFILSGRYIDVSWYIWDPDSHVENSYLSSYTFQEYTGPVYPNEEPDNDVNYMNSEKVVASYPDGDGGGTPPTTIEVYQVYDGSWINDYRWTWIQMVDSESEMDESWSGTEWHKEYYNMDYWTDALTYNIYESYTDGVLISASKNSELFDGFGNQTESKSETHTGDENWMQVSGEMWDYEYEGATSKVLTKIKSDWNGSMYVNYMREQFEYSATNLDLLVKEGIKIYPTAFMNNIAVQSEYSGKIFIYNLGGAKVLEQIIGAGTNSINTDDFERGLYIVKVQTSKGESIQKIIKQ